MRGELGRRAAVNPTELWGTKLVLLIALASLLSCQHHSPAAAYDQAWSAYATGDLNLAVRLSSDAAARWRKDSRWRSKFSLLEAEALSAEGNYARAEELVNRAVTPGTDFNPTEARRMVDMASIRSSKPAEAAGYLRKAELLDPGPDTQVRIRLTRGILALNSGQPNHAEDEFRAAGQLASQYGLLYWQAQSLNNLAYAVRRLGNYEAAVQTGLQALSLAEKAGARRVAAQAHVNLGTAYSYLGESDTALDDEERAARILGEIGDRPNLMIALGELGLMYDAREEREKAIASYERAFDMAQTLGRANDAARNAENVALAFIHAHNWSAAHDWNRRAFEIATANHVQDILPYLARNDARIAFENGNAVEAIRICEDLLRSHPQQADVRWEAYNLLGEIYTTEKLYTKANTSFENALEIIDNTRSELLNSHYRITLLSRLIPFYREYVRSLVLQNDDAGALRVVESSRARVLAERLGQKMPIRRFPGVSGLRQIARQTNAFMLSFWLAPDRSFAWLITADSIQRFDLPPEAEIEKLVTRYREVVEHSLKNPISSSDSSAAVLWTRLMAGIYPHIPKNSRLIVVPDGSLHRLNLETLVVPAARPHYWIEEAEIAIAPSLTIAALPPRRAGTQSPSLLLIGAPDYAGTEYQALKNASAEIRDIQNRFAGHLQEVLAGPRAVPAAYRESMPARFSLIHFAAHAEANGENPLESAVILSHAGKEYKLYAREVVDIPIQADLVTISACRTAGIRAYAGEGLIGFAWAFLQAGARAVVAGLWDVSDSSTEPLMNAFYEGIASGQDPASAMHRAKLSLMERDTRYAKPFYWGPFQVYIGSALATSRAQ